MESTNQKLVDELDAKQILSKINAHEKARTVLNAPVYRHGILVSLMSGVAPIFLFVNMPWPLEIKVVLGLSIGVTAWLFVELLHIRRRLDAAIVLLNERESRDSP
jgi:hypothetical protein